MYIYQHYILHELWMVLLVILLLWLDLCSGIIAAGINDDDVCVCACVRVCVCACINSRLGKTKWVEICTYCLASSAGLGGPQWSRSEREMETALLFVKLPNADAPGTAARVMKLQTCSNSASFHTTSCLGRVFPTNSFRTLACEWFTAKRNALWISLLFNLSRRPLKHRLKCTNLLFRRATYL